ncbi:MAG: SlyX [Planctomycetaceae bacterium]|nr:SlyX [Planctomycetaceae bacterium]
MDQTEVLSNRVTELEIRCMQLQQEFDALNDVVLGQQRELFAWRAAFARFETRLDNLADPEPPRDPLAEQPPHY